MRFHEAFFWFLAVCIGLVLVAIPYGHLVANDPLTGPGGMDYKDLVVIQLAAVTALVGTLGVGIGILTIWGYREFIGRADATAKAVAAETVATHLKSDHFKKSVLDAVAENAKAQAAATVAPPKTTVGVDDGGLERIPEPPAGGT